MREIVAIVYEVLVYEYYPMKCTQTNNIRLITLPAIIFLNIDICVSSDVVNSILSLHALHFLWSSCPQRPDYILSKLSDFIGIG